MNTRYLKTMLILGLLFIFQGCSFYAGFSVKEKSSLAASTTAGSEGQTEAGYNLAQDERR